MSFDSGFDLCLEYIRWRNGLVETSPDGALVVLPPSLQDELGLPEEAAVTSYPEVAGQGGFRLLGTGHAVVERLSRKLLAAGDASVTSVPALRSTPGVDRLLDWARAAVDVEHGRLDRGGGVPVGVGLPILRVEALVTYTLEDVFEEREEAWVDGTWGLRLGPELVERLRPIEPIAVSPGDRVLEPDLALALRGAHREIGERAKLRAGALSRQQVAELAGEAAAAEAYYAGVLASTRHRLEQAPADRRHVYESRLAVTQEERMRRLEEITQKSQPKIDVAPFRLQLVFLPGLLIRLEVRRGERHQPLTLLWESVTGRFLPVGCPFCGQGEPLVAGRERLGCRACLPRQASPQTSRDLLDVTLTARSGPGGEPAAPKPEPPRSESTESGRSEAGARQQTFAGEARIPQLKATRSESRRQLTAAPDSARTADFQDRWATLRRDAARIERVGGELAFKFWDRALLERQRWRRVASGSPLDVLYEALGDSAPLHVIGISRSDEPQGVDWESRLLSSALHAVTLGTLTTTRGQHDFLIRWRLVDGRAVVSEVLPDHNALMHPSAETWPHLFSPPPPRRLDDVARRLWDVEISILGLAFAARCLSTRRLARPGWEAGAGPDLVAATLSLRTGRSLGRQRSLEQVASAHGVDPKELGRVDGRLRKALEARAAHSWA